MKIANSNRKSSVKLMLTFLLLSISACGNNGDSGNNSVSTSTANQLTTLQNQLDKLQELVITLQTDNASLQNRLTTDEGAINKIALVGHVPGTDAALEKHTSMLRQHPLGVTESISFGPCVDMGVLVGAEPDSMTATTENFRQCTGYEYGVIVETGAIAKAVILWFDGPNCSGNMFEAENDGSYNRQALQEGVVFVSPIDGTTELMVTAGQQGESTVLQSNFSDGSCNSPATETQLAYHVTANELALTGIPPAVPTNFIL